MILKTSTYAVPAAILSVMIWGCQHTDGDAVQPHGPLSVDKTASNPTHPVRRTLRLAANTSPKPTLSRLRWDRDVTTRPKGLERVAQGPSSIAIDESGSAFILDQLSGRIIKQPLGGPVIEHATVDHDAVDISVGREGKLSAFSQVRARAVVFDRSGREILTVPVPRMLRHVRHLEWGPGNSLWAHSPYQERFRLSNAEGPSEGSAVLRSKREGAVELNDGRRFAASVVDQRASLIEFDSTSEAGRTRVHRKHQLDAPATAARLIGAWKQTVCLRLEHVESSPALTVKRRVTCIDTQNEQVTLDVELGSVGTYLPHRELAMGGGWLVHMLPQPGALVTKRWRVGS